MEKYIQKINDKLIEANDIEKARKTKKMYQTIGGLLLAVGLAGFLALFVAFMILFLKFQTDSAFTCWIIAVPFLLMLIPGSVLARIGDALLPDDKKSTKKVFKGTKYKSQKLEKENQEEHNEKQD